MRERRIKKKSREEYQAIWADKVDEMKNVHTLQPPSLSIKRGSASLTIVSGDRRIAEVFTEDLPLPSTVIWEL